MRIQHFRQRLRDLGAKPCHEEAVLRSWSQSVPLGTKYVRPEDFLPLQVRHGLPELMAEVHGLARLHSEHASEDGSTRLLLALAAAARSLDQTLPVHLKVDTGMGRLGVLPQEVLPFLASLKKMRHLKVMGLISHLAVADQADKTYTYKQLQEFTALLAAARAEGFKLPLSHIANSAALWELPEAHAGLVRPGLMLYGSPPAPDRPPPVELQPVMSLAARVLQVKRLPPGSSISYGCTYTTPDWCDLAVLPVGYCNGYSRLGSNRGEVLIHGHRAPIRGRVCMNLTMVDVTGLPEVKEGDVVDIFVDRMENKEGEAVLSVDGQNPIPLAPGDSVEVRAGEYPARFVRFGDVGYFYRNLTTHMNQNPSTGLSR